MRHARSTVSIDLVRLVLAYAARRGVQAPAPPQASGPRVDAGAFDRWLGGLGAHDPCFGLHLGASAERFPASHLVLATVFNSPTLGEALRRLSRYHTLLSDALLPELVRRPDALLIRLSARPPLGRHARDAALGMLVTLVRRLSPGVRLCGASLRHRADVDRREYERVLRAPVSFDADDDTLALPPSAAGAPVLLADPELLNWLERQAERRLTLLRDTSVAATARSVVMTDLFGGNGVPRLDALARGLGCSTRTLQARLRAAGTSYRAIVDETRHELAELWLAEGAASLAELAYLLGFSDQSAFNHAFRRWTGRTPLKHRRGARGASGPR